MGCPSICCSFEFIILQGKSIGLFFCCFFLVYQPFGLLLFFSLASGFFMVVGWDFLLVCLGFFVWFWWVFFVWFFFFLIGFFFSGEMVIKVQPKPFCGFFRNLLSQHIQGCLCSVLTLQLLWYRNLCCSCLCQSGKQLVCTTAAAPVGNWAVPAAAHPTHTSIFTLPTFSLFNSSFFPLNVCWRKLSEVADKMSLLLPQPACVPSLNPSLVLSWEPRPLLFLVHWRVLSWSLCRALGAGRTCSSSMDQ